MYAPTSLARPVIPEITLRTDRDIYYGGTVPHGLNSGPHQRDRVVSSLSSLAAKPRWKALPSAQIFDAAPGVRATETTAVTAHVTAGVMVRTRRSRNHHSCPPHPAAEPKPKSWYDMGCLELGVVCRSFTTCGMSSGVGSVLPRAYFKFIVEHARVRLRWLAQQVGADSLCESQTHGTIDIVHGQ